MASADLLRAIFQSYGQRNDDAFYAAALQIVADEKRKNHNVLAQELMRILENGRVPPSSVLARELTILPHDKDRGTTLVEVRTPDRTLDDIVLDAITKKQISAILEENRSSHLLRTYGLKPDRRILFAGPPGCGKTLCAEIIAGELGVPLLYARFDSIISSFLGETAANIRKVFDHAAKGMWVVFFDEFDAIGKSRDDTSEHGELKRVVNAFLQMLDNFRSESLMIAATNHEGILDQALWRRFDEIVFFDKPDSEQIYHLLQLKLRSYPHKSVALEELAARMLGLAHADIEWVCIEAIKVSILQGRDSLRHDDLVQALERQNHRQKLINRSKSYMRASNGRGQQDL